MPLCIVQCSCSDFDSMTQTSQASLCGAESVSGLVRKRDVYECVCVSVCVHLCVSMFVSVWSHSSSPYCTQCKQKGNSFHFSYFFFLHTV